MSEQEQEEIAALLKQSVTRVDRELHRDLWPQMLHSLDERAASGTWISQLLSLGVLSSVPWFDWALLAVLVAGICLFPKTIPIWLYQF